MISYAFTLILLNFAFNLFMFWYLNYLANYTDKINDKLETVQLKKKYKIIIISQVIRNF